MSREVDCLYVFGEFELDPREKQLRLGKEPMNLAPREFDTLLLLVRHNGHLLEKSEIMSTIWGEVTVEESNLNLIISNLRRTLNDDPFKPTYIETVRKRGFRFIAEVANRHRAGTVAPSATATAPNDNTRTEEAPSAVGPTPTDPTRRKLKRVVTIGAPLVLVASAMAIAIFGHREIHAPFEEVEVKRVVRESQMYETLAIYTNPKVFDRSDLSKYWVPVEQGGKEIKAVEAAIDRLLSQGWHYGPDSRSDLFEFRYVRILAPGDIAEVGTIERWHVPTLKDDGSPVLERNVNLGPQQIDYRLKKISGVWLIQDNTTPRPRRQ
jgi:DNA-binding winged helix-turn-helix (wHTH) protein